MDTDQAWALMDPMTSFAPMTPGLSTDVSSGGLSSAGIISHPPRTSPDDPMFWFAVITAVTLGLVGASTHLRVGPFKVAAAAGKD